MAQKMRDEKAADRRNVTEKEDASRNIRWVDTSVKQKPFSQDDEAENHTGAGWGISGRRKWRQWIQAVLLRNQLESPTENKRDKSWEVALRREEESLDKQLRVIKERADLEQVETCNELGRQTSSNLLWHQFAWVGNSL